MVYLQQTDVLAGYFHKTFRLQLVQAADQGELLYAETFCDLLTRSAQVKQFASLLLVFGMKEIYHFVSHAA